MPQLWMAEGSIPNWRAIFLGIVSDVDHHLMTGHVATGMRVKQIHGHCVKYAAKDFTPNAEQGDGICGRS